MSATAISLEASVEVLGDKLTENDENINALRRMEGVDTKIKC